MLNRLTIDRRRAKKVISLHHALKIRTLDEALIENLNCSTPNWEHAVSIVADMYESINLLEDHIYNNFEEEM
jgi:hypothetical protein